MTKLTVPVWSLREWLTKKLNMYPHWAKAAAKAGVRWTPAHLGSWWAHELTVLPTGPYLRSKNSLRNGSAWGKLGPGADSVSSVNPEKNTDASFLGTSVMESKIIWRIGIFYIFLLWLQGTLLFSHLHITLEFRFAFAFSFSCNAHGPYFCPILQMRQLITYTGWHMQQVFSFQVFCWTPPNIYVK